MDPVTLAEKLEPKAQFGRGVQQAGEPGERNRDRAAIDETHDQLVVGDANVLS
jgi:hypothetical protein